MKRQASEGFALIPEGEQVIRVKEVDESEYAKFQKLTVVVEDASGATSKINFNFVNDDGTTNEVADGIYTRMGRALMDDQTLDEIDTADWPGRYALVEIVHNEGAKGGKFANVKKWIGPATGFPKGAKAPAKTAPAASSGGQKKSAAERIAELKAKRAAG